MSGPVIETSAQRGTGIRPPQRRGEAATGAPPRSGARRRWHKQPQRRHGICIRPLHCPDKSRTVQTQPAETCRFDRWLQCEPQGASRAGPVARQDCAAPDGMLHRADAPIAQLVEHLICNQEVGGSSPSGGASLSLARGWAAPLWSASQMCSGAGAGPRVRHPLDPHRQERPGNPPPGQAGSGRNRCCLPTWSDFAGPPAWPGATAAGDGALQVTAGAFPVAVSRWAMSIPLRTSSHTPGRPPGRNLASPPARPLHPDGGGSGTHGGALHAGVLPTARAEHATHSPDAGHPQELAEAADGLVDPRLDGRRRGCQKGRSRGGPE